LRYLQRYEALYDSLGYETLSVIASPQAIANTSLHSPSTTTTVHFPSNSNRIGATPQHLKSTDNIDTIEELAWKVLKQIYTKNPEYYMFHVFSNGGCFLWESACQILLNDKRFQNNSKNNDQQQQQQDILTELSLKCKGVVFDSCPAWFGSEPAKLWLALQHCTDKEKEDVISVHGDRVYTLDDDMKKRNQEYFDFLHNNKMDVPQLYLYSMNDNLSIPTHITNLVNIRRSVQKQPVLQKVWEESIHCAHLLQHPNEYKQAIKEFLIIATLQSAL
jgi:hypothetical protein